MQRTVSQPVRFVGTGLHSGHTVAACVLPAPPGSGIRFRRTDLADAAAEIPARHDRVIDTRLCTRLGNRHGVSVGTVEHLMAALAGTGVSDAVIAVDGPELPILDGSARPFVAGLVDAGFAGRSAPRRAIRILAPVEVAEDGKRARLEPWPCFSLAFRIAFADPAIGVQELALDLSGDGFARELADCRTFGHLAEVEQLRRAGLARGGGLENAVVVDRGRVLNPEGLRRPDEFVRHKMLDAVGDLALAGAPIVGRYVGERAGHGMTNKLLHALFARPDAWEWASARLGTVPGGEQHVPDRPAASAAWAV